jgi:hypothetical protein
MLDPDVKHSQVIVAWESHVKLDIELTLHFRVARYLKDAAFMGWR